MNTPVSLPIGTRQHELPVQDRDRHDQDGFRQWRTVAERPSKENFAMALDRVCFSGDLCGRTCDRDVARNCDDAWRG